MIMGYRKLHQDPQSRVKEYRGFTSWVDDVHAEKGGRKPGAKSSVKSRIFGFHQDFNGSFTVKPSSEVQLLDEEGKEMGSPWETKS